MKKKSGGKKMKKCGRLFIREKGRAGTGNASLDNNGSSGGRGMGVTDMSSAKKEEEFRSLSFILSLWPRVCASAFFDYLHRMGQDVTRIHLKCKSLLGILSNGNHRDTRIAFHHEPYFHRRRHGDSRPLT